MAVTLDGIVLPDDIEWINRYVYSPLRQVQNHSVRGALILQHSVQLKGRPITLQTSVQGATASGAVLQSTVEALRAIEIGGREMVFLYSNGQTYNVTWRTSEGPPIEATPLLFKAPTLSTDYYAITLRLIQI